MELFSADILGLLAMMSTVVIGLVTVATNAGFPKRFGSVLAIFVGIFVSILIAPPMSFGMVVISGIMVGLSASGMYSFPKSFNMKTPATPTDGSL